MSETLPAGGLVAALRGVLPPSCVLRVWSGDDEPALYPEEAGAVARAVAVRRLEFARGRACAREAITALGVTAAPIPVGPDREPVWPQGVVGSITHCEGFVAAVAARSADVRAIGLDAETAAPVGEDVAARVVRPSERRPELGELGDTVLFSAKESIHKAVFPLERLWLGFRDVSVRLDPERGAFRVTAAPGAKVRAAHLSELRGRYVIGAGLVATICYLRDERGRAISEPT